MDGNELTMRKEGVGMTVFYSILHFFVDGVCALAMFGRFLPGEKGRFYILIYNFCAFALQMPMGVLLDAWSERCGRRRECAFLTAAAGVLCTLAGAVLHPAVLGIGNALFHVGGGVGTIHEDGCRMWRGRGLGVFVAPGALGLYFGTLAGKSGVWRSGLGIAGVCMALFGAGAAYCAYLQRRMVRSGGAGNGLESLPDSDPTGTFRLWPVTVCLAVVILRSYMGMAVDFSWKSGVPAGALAVLALAAGKTAGGFAAARYGLRRSAVISLGAAAVCYLFPASMPLGLGALFLFNMTMPMTLYFLVCHMSHMPGFAFGILTFGLFLGFLPSYFGLLPGSGGLAGCGGSLVSLILLAWIFPGKKKDGASIGR
ncbi:MAG: hypothetical protein K2G28_12705 [Acetatifactor sp.]|nr:hypothetical protein [Acetatifactor sp.]MDE7354761.1 hypothetical protein [Acetatifactor sp.]